MFIPNKNVTFAARMKAFFRKICVSLSPDGIVVWWLAVWWICNLLQATYTGLANDEAYYHMFAQKLAWGYFDHPPMTALFVWLGEHLFGGELGVRFIFTLLQPLYLYILWRLVRPVDVDRRDGALFVMIAATTLMLQLYGFIAVPDGPLMVTVALFLLCFKGFASGCRASWFWLGIAMAAMAYSKYHGALVVVFALAVNPRLLLRPGLYLSVLVTGLLLWPHLLWQYHHDWVSFTYHLAGRNAEFQVNYVTEYLLNLLLVFNPFYVPLYVQAWRKVHVSNAVERTLRFLPPAFILFFLVSAIRGHVQPQWLIASVFGFVYILFVYARRHPRTRSYVMRVGAVTLVLLLLVRIEMILNPLGLRLEIFNNPVVYGRIAETAAGRPVIFRDSYATSAKYGFYTGEPVYCQSSVFYRTHQWQYRDDDRHFTGKPVLIECDPGMEDSAGRIRTIHLADGHTFSYVEEADFHPTREVDISVEKGLSEEVRAGDTLHLQLRISNPYPYAIKVDGKEMSLVILWRAYRNAQEFPFDTTFMLPANGEVETNVQFVVPETLAGKCYETGFALRKNYYSYWFNGKPLRVEVVE